MSDESTNDRAILPEWPQGDGNSQRKREVTDALLGRAPDPALALVALGALTKESAKHYASELICAVLHHEGNETVDADGSSSYDTDALANCYQRALQAATSTDVRIAIHWGFSGFRPRGSKDGRMSSSASSVVEERFLSSWDDHERSELANILAAHSSVPSERLREDVNQRLDGKAQSVSREMLNLWEKLTTSDRGGWDWEGQRTDASKRLIGALQRAENDDVRTHMLRMLAGEFFTNVCEEVFEEQLRHPTASVREAATTALVRCGPRARELAAGVLEHDGDTGPLDAAWRYLEEGGMDTLSIIHTIAKNPHIDCAARVILNHTHDSHTNRGRTLQNAWAGLPPRLRDELVREWRFDRHRFHHRMHHPACEELYFGLERGVRGSDSPGLRALAASLLDAAPEPLDAYDFDAVTGLKRASVVDFLTLDLVRFQFLADARSREAVPLAEILAAAEFDIPALVDLEIAFDRDRDLLASTRAEITTLQAELGADVAASLRERMQDLPARRMRQKPELSLLKAAPRFLELEARYARLYDAVTIAQSEGPYARLRSATLRALPILLEVGCSFDGMAAPDGVFAEYDPKRRSITVFGPMVELGALEAARELGRPVEEVRAQVRTIVEIHELAHAQMHLGVDASGQGWRSPGTASRDYHEAVAQSYTRRMARLMNASDLLGTLRVIDSWLPAEYRWADLLESASPEALRAHVVARRESGAARTLAEVAGIVLQAMPGYVQMIRSRLDGKRLGLLRPPLEAFIVAAATAESAQGTAAAPALARLLERAAELPHGPALFGPLIPGGWASPSDLRWLEFEAVTEGDPVGDAPLRIIRRADFIAAVSAARSSAYLALVPAVRESRAAVEQLLAFAGRDPDDEYFGPAEQRTDRARKPKRKAG